MDKKLFSSAEEFQSILPVEIKIQVYGNLFEPKFFDKDGQPMYILVKKKSMNIIYEYFEDFSDELYIELLSIDNTIKAEDFINKYPNFCFSFPDDYGREYQEKVISRKNYLRIMLRDIRLFRVLNILYKDVCIMLNEPTNMNALQSVINTIATDYNLALNSQQRNELTFLLDSHGSLLSANSMIDKLIKKFTSFVERQTATIRLVTFSKPCIEFCCPSLLSAMHQKMILSAFNHVEYRECANKFCTNYFRVGNKTTQKFCESHLQARRRKQEKYHEIHDKEDIQ